MNHFKVVVVGCGGMSKIWVEHALARQDAEIVALVDIVAENARKMAANYQLDCPVFTDLKEAIKTTGADLVFDITIPDTHKLVTTTALQLGCHVFGEKPMGSSMNDAQEMLNLAKKTGRTYAVMQNRRYLKQIRAYRDLVISGRIGEPGYIGADFFLGPHFGGFREIMDSPLILDMAIHTFDQARFITGKNPVSVYCQEFNLPGSWFQGNASAVCIFEWEDGSVFCYRGSWSAVGAPTSWESEWRVAASKGTAIWDGKNEPYAEIIPEQAQEEFLPKYERIHSTVSWEGREGHNGCLDEMFASLHEGRMPETDCSDNIKSVGMVYGAIESALTGKKVALV